MNVPAGVNVIVTAAARADRRTVGGLVLACTAAVAVAPVAVAVPPRLLLVALAGLGLVTVTYLHPPVAAYLMLVATPLTAGFPRGMVVPLLRPHEALGIVLGTGVLARALAQLSTAGRLPVRPGPVDVAFLLMAGAGSVLPLLWMVVRGTPTTQEDLLYASALWKFYGLYVLIRICVTTEPQVRRCLYLSMGAAGVVAVIAILQSLDLAGVPDLLARLYPAEDATGLASGRGSATIGSSISVGDVMAFHVAIGLALLLRTPGPHRLLLPMTALFGVGTLASGQFSGVIALVVCVFVVAVLSGQVRRLIVMLVPAAVLAAVLLQPVIQQRLAHRDMSTGMPQSWYVRYENLRLFVWPDLFSGPNWLFGVRPAARIDVVAPWGTEIYIESGHTWLLWTGGIPFLLAYLWFMVVALRTTVPVARSRRDAVGVAATAALAALLSVFVLMSFDPHLTMRGAADLTFSLVALATAAHAQTRGAHRGRATVPSVAGSTSYT
jgi:hypothetical protein